MIITIKYIIAASKRWHRKWDNRSLTRVVAKSVACEWSIAFLPGTHPAKLSLEHSYSPVYSPVLLLQRDGNCMSWATLAGWTKGTEQWEYSYYIRWSQSDHRQNNSNNRNIIINTLLFNYALHCSKSLDLICIRQELETITVPSTTTADGNLFYNTNITFSI